MFIDITMTFPTSGRVKEWRIHGKVKGKLKFQVWRPLQHGN
jgi:hypothetical protein